jgi:hypothetical protein
MPPKFDRAQEQRINEALNELKSNPTLKNAYLARKYRVPDSTLRARRKGRPPASSKGGNNKTLTQAQDTALKGCIAFLNYIGQPPTKYAIKTEIESDSNNREIDESDEESVISVL